MAISFLDHHSCFLTLLSLLGNPSLCHPVNRLWPAPLLHGQQWPPFIESFLCEPGKSLVLLNTWKHCIFITTLKDDYSYLHFADEVKDPMANKISQILAPSYDPVMLKVSTWPGSLHYSPKWTPDSDDGPNFLLHQHCFYLSASGSASSLCLKYLIGFCLASGIPIILQDPEGLSRFHQTNENFLPRTLQGRDSASWHLSNCHLSQELHALG